MAKEYSVIRLDDDGNPDDVVISGDLVRIERMDDDMFWLAVYRGNKRTAFSIYGKFEEAVVLRVIEDELGCTDDTQKKEPPTE